ncbi:MAG: type II secretion system F family protein, partial [Pirellulaceae bacterium]|nr:type II secretion system F family protein [Pirellulaceae bacterium]
MSFLFAAGLIRIETFVPIAVFGAIGALAWFLLDLVAGGHSRAVQRLEELRSPAGSRDSDSTLPKRKGERVAKVIEQAAPALAKPLQSQDQETVDQLKVRLSNAGFRSES